jgi:hypothetical protein
MPQREAENGGDMKGEKLSQRNMSQDNLQEPTVSTENSKLKCSYTNGKNPETKELSHEDMCKIGEC